jgi:hypothetical protein
MSRSQFYSIKLFILRHAWLNLWDKHMTTGRINQVNFLLARNCTVTEHNVKSWTELRGNKRSHIGCKLGRKSPAHNPRRESSLTKSNNKLYSSVTSFTTDSLALSIRFTAWYHLTKLQRERDFSPTRGFQKDHARSRQDYTRTQQ